ncbi:hypothetical protein CKAH01_04275 [Colletotrichum kahawae]|uniref:Uncharacterized protein n=1 Tax=Colletotrichum kahawae TaxID=34407 RepID=A0AAD9YMC6_COLKA|nr:hypothetical protein CKAH01_04275 [Colletotrichum kahawae]
MGRTRGEEKGNGERSTLKGDWRATVRVVVWAGGGKGKKRRGGKGEVGFCEYFFSTSVAFAGSPWALALAGLGCWLLAGTPRSPHLLFFFFFLPEHLQVPCRRGI